MQRLATWYRLERAGPGARSRSVVASNRAKVDGDRAAQARRAAPDAASRPSDLLALVLTISGDVDGMTPEYNALVSRHGRAHRRQVVIDAVTALLAERP